MTKHMKYLRSVDLAQPELLKDLCLHTHSLAEISKTMGTLSAKLFKNMDFRLSYAILLQVEIVLKCAITIFICKINEPDYTHLEQSRFCSHVHFIQSKNGHWSLQALKETHTARKAQCGIPVIRRSSPKNIDLLLLIVLLCKQNNYLYIYTLGKNVHSILE